MIIHVMTVLALLPIPHVFRNHIILIAVYLFFLVREWRIKSFPGAEERVCAWWWRGDQASWEPPSSERKVDVFGTCPERECNHETTWWWWWWWWWWWSQGRCGWKGKRTKTFTKTRVPLRNRTLHICLWRILFLCGCYCLQTQALSIFIISVGELLLIVLCVCVCTCVCVCVCDDSTHEGMRIVVNVVVFSGVSRSCVGRRRWRRWRTQTEILPKRRSVLQPVPLSHRHAMPLQPRGVWHAGGGGCGV